MQKNILILGIGAVLLGMSGDVRANSPEDLALSIYGNRALVRDVRRFALPEGKSSVLFTGVSGQIQPESIIVSTQGVWVREQNYNYAMMSPENVAKANIGKKVKTVYWDEKRGQNIYDQAELIDVYEGQPVLRFDYGIDFGFPGRIVWEKLPDNLQTKPSLYLGLESSSSGDKLLDLMYLTGGLSWRANYVAEFVNDSALNLKTWVSINNTSGIDYENARVQLVAGDTNTVYQHVVRPMLMANASRSMGKFADMAAEAAPSEESVGEYHVYSLPDKITLADNQTKQISLLGKDDVKYEKEYRLASPLYLSLGTKSGEFKNVHADTYVKLQNTKEANLGEPLPQGVVRFYDHDSKGNTLFMGEAAFKQLAVGEETELKIGKSFDISASGKVVTSSKISDQTVETEVSVVFKNAKSEAIKTVFEQYFAENWEILSASIEEIGRAHV